MEELIYKFIDSTYKKKEVPQQVYCELDVIFSPDKNTLKAVIHDYSLDWFNKINQSLYQMKQMRDNDSFKYECFSMSPDIYNDYLLIRNNLGLYSKNNNLEFEGIEIISPKMMYNDKNIIYLC